MPPAPRPRARDRRWRGNRAKAEMFFRCTALRGETRSLRYREPQAVRAHRAAPDADEGCPESAGDATVRNRWRKAKADLAPATGDFDCPDKNPGWANPAARQIFCGS